MTRKLALLLAACLGLWHGSAWALGLGEIEVRSALNERFSATIDLRRIEALSQNEVIASLASAEDFSRLGVQRFFYLSELEFAADLTDRSRPKIVVSSNRPINEPFVNFVIDVRWPTGRMLREYTVLLDPPALAERPAPAMRPAESGATAQRAQSSEPARSTGAAPAAGRVRTEAQSSAGSGRFDGATYGVTDRDDTLWAIALEVRPSTDVSVHQTMLALQRMNPDAFIRGNINLLKAGFILEIPSADEIARLSRQDAIVQVAEHNLRWRDGTPAMPVDARPEVASGESGSRSGGELRLVAGEDDDVRVTREATPAGAGIGGAVEGLRGDLAAAESRLSEAETARRAAEQQRQDAANELEEVSRQLELRNQELARLQRLLAEQQRQGPDVAAQRPAAQGPLGMSWTLLAAGLAALVVIIAAVLLLLRRRRRQGEDDFLAEEEQEARAGSKPVQHTQLMSAISKEDLARAGVAAAAGGAGDDESDVIAEADVYMAYGRFSEAARVLNSAIVADGQRADLRLKLMEVLVETQDVDAFNAQAEALRGFADDNTIDLADDLASRLPGAVTSTGATSQGELAGPARAADEGEVSLDFDLGDDFGEPADLDSLDIDFDASTRNNPGTAAGAVPAATLAAAKEAEEEAKKEADDDDLMLMLDDDDGIDSDGAASAKADSGEDDTLDFDFGESTPVADDQADELDLDGDERSLDETLAHADPAVRDASTDAAGDDDFSFDLPADAEATKGPSDDEDDDVTALRQRDQAPAETEATEDDLEFDLTMDGSSFVDKPVANANANANETDGDGDDELDDLEFDLAGGAGDAAGDPAGQAAGDPAATAETDEEDLSFDFDVEDLPADADDNVDDDRDDDRDDITEPRRAAGNHGLQPSGAATLAAGELPVDLAEDDLEFGMDFDESGDETTTKLELARAYMDMGDEDGAKEILDEVVRDGNDTQQQEAAELLRRLV